MEKDHEDKLNNLKKQNLLLVSKLEDEISTLTEQNTKLKNHVKIQAKKMKTQIDNIIKLETKLRQSKEKGATYLSKYMNATQISLLGDDYASNYAMIDRKIDDLKQLIQNSKNVSDNDQKLII